MRKLVQKLSKSSYFFLFFCLVVFLFFTINYLLQIPPVWPDDAVIADISYNLMNENRLGTDLWKGFTPATQNHGVAYPPLFNYLEVVVFKIFGFSIYSIRLLTVFIGFFAIVAFYFLLKFLPTPVIDIGQRRILKILFFLTLVINVTFLKAARIGRPDILVILFSLLSLLMYFLSLKIEKKNFKKVFLSFSGGLLGLGIISHYSAVIYFASFLMFFLVTKRFQILRSWEFYYFFVPTLIPFLLWLLFLFPNMAGFWSLFSEQFVAHSKQISLGWFWISMVQSPLFEKIVHILYIIISWEVAVLYFRKKVKIHLLILLIIINSWFVTLAWKIEYGFSLIVPAVFLGLWILLIEYQSEVAKKALTITPAIILTFLMIVSSLFLQLGYIQEFPKGTYSYDLYIQKIKEVIPEGKVVYISAIPDPYFGFKGGRNNTLYAAPIFYISSEKMVEMLDSSDYVIFNQPLGIESIRTLTLNYLSKNVAQTHFISDPAEYKTFVYELKPRDQRVKN